MSKKRISPPGYSTLCPYLIVDDVVAQLYFIVQVFGGVEIGRMEHDQDVVHGEVSIGEVAVMIGKSRPEWPARQGMNYVFTLDVMGVFDKAMSSGAERIMTPEKRSYGLVEGGFIDPFGNQWWIAERS